MRGRLPFPSEISDPIILADWLELLAITTADGNASHGNLQRELNRLAAENIVGVCMDTMSELRRRTESTGSNYPFTFTGTLLESIGDWRDYVPYVFCLLLSFADDQKKKVRGLHHEVMFEQLSCIAARNYIGGEVVRFGAPRLELPPGFKRALVELCNRLQEWTPSTTRIRGQKDGNLDLVAWKHFPDRQTGKLILFGHCASGKNWDTKINELQPHDFCNLWLASGASPIVKTFFIPHRLPAEEFAIRSVPAKLFFDRCRIAHCVSNDEFIHNTSNGSLKWCETVLKMVLV
jgi:hypothetical protein